LPPRGGEFKSPLRHAEWLINHIMPILGGSHGLGFPIELDVRMPLALGGDPALCLVSAAAEYWAPAVPGLAENRPDSLNATVSCQDPHDVNHLQVI